MVMSYATLTEIKNQYEANNESLASVTDSKMFGFARRATAKVDLITLREFAPRIETKYFDAGGNHIIQGRRALELPSQYPILELTTATLASGTVLVTGTDVRTSPRDLQPSWELTLLQASSSNWTDVGANDAIDGISILGVWGWRDRYDSEGWRDADTTGEAIATTTETEFDITGEVTATNWVNDTPNFDIGQLIKIDSEYMAVVNTTSNTALTKDTITVVRGVRGTTAALHDSGATISVFVPQPAITRATQLMAMFDYSRRGETTRVSFDGVTTRAGLEVPVEVAEILDRYTTFGVSS